MCKVIEFMARAKQDHKQTVSSFSPYHARIVKTGKRKNACSFVLDRAVKVTLLALGCLSLLDCVFLRTSDAHQYMAVLREVIFTVKFRAKPADI